MALVDLPPGLNVMGRHAQEHLAPPRPRRLARICTWVCFFAVIAVVLTSFRRYYHPGTEVFLVGTLACWMVSLVCWGVRKATLQVSSDGISWGWGAFRVSMKHQRIDRISFYDDVIAFRPRKGGTWYVSQRDWVTFAGLRNDIQKQGWQTVSMNSPAPLKAKLQSYGMTVNAMAVGSALLSIALTIGRFLF